MASALAKRDSSARTFAGEALRGSSGAWLSMVPAPCRSAAAIQRQHHQHDASAQDFSLRRYIGFALGFDDVEGRGDPPRYAERIARTVALIRQTPARDRSIRSRRTALTTVSHQLEFSELSQRVCE
jgi:hypothetical protein